MSPSSVDKHTSGRCLDVFLFLLKRLSLEKKNIYINDDETSVKIRKYQLTCKDGKGYFAT